MNILIGRILPKSNCLVAAVAMWLFLGGCGYQFAVQRSFPAGIKTLNVGVFKNRTTETGLEIIFTNDLMSEISKNRSVTLTDKAEADAFLAGVISSIQTETISHRGQYASDERRVNVVVAVRLFNAAGKTIWRNRKIQGHSTYKTDINRDRTMTEQNRLTALKALSITLAENIYSQMTNAF